MTLDLNSGPAREDALRFLQLSARLLLEYDNRTALLKRRIDQLAKHLGVKVQTVVGYRDVTLITEGGQYLHSEAKELRINVAVRIATFEVLDGLCENRIGLTEAIQRLEMVERTTPRHGRVAVATIFGLSTSAFAWLLGADWGTIAVSGAATGLGVIARQEVAKKNAILFASPFTAALIGGLLGGIAIRLGWIHTPGLCLIMPALMLVPGPQFINSIDDILENHIPRAVFRVVLAMGILLSAALGAVLGGWVAGSLNMLDATPFDALPLSLPLDVALAGLAACGVAAFYNSPWRVLWISVLCGMVGHGLRYVCLHQDLGMPAATLIACTTIGVIASFASNRLRLPFSAVAFAGAVTMMPGFYMFESIAAAMQLATAGKDADPTLAATALALSFKAWLIVGAMAIGLFVGARLTGLVDRRDSSGTD